MRFTQARILQVLLTILVTLTQSQNGPGRTCQRGWFGSNCQYKCHCKDTTCDDSGMCGDGACKTGWFGPACQYMDLFFTNSTQQTLSWLKDNNNSTCNNNKTLQAITVDLTSEFPFTWLRLQVKNPSLLQEFQVTFSNRNNQVRCKNMRNATVNERTLDVHCDLDVTVQTVTLTGEGVKSLCSLYISGGRNVALRQSTSQSSTYLKETNIKPYSGKAVDGNVSGKWHDNSCSCTNTGDTNPTWNVTFSQEQRINRYVLYNRDKNQQRLQKFTLTSVTNNNEIVFKHTDNETQSLHVYTISSVNRTSPITLVNIQADNNRKTSDLYLTLCEVELYGDSVCPPSKYGRECQYTCNCAVKNETCFVSTGGCPSGCSPGFQGESCNKPCDLGKYGKSCNSNCSQFCVAANNSESPCNYLDGRCLYGCQSGYQAPKCNHVIMNNDSATFAAVLIPLVIIVLIIAAVIGVILWKRQNNPIIKKTSEAVSNSAAVKFTDGINSTENELETTPGYQYEQKLNSSNKRVMKQKQIVKDSKTEDFKDDVYNNITFKMSSTTVAIGNLSSFMASHDKAFFQQQFNTIPANTDATMTTGTSAENKHKNRYKNICAYDHSRVLLKINKEKNHGDYINASYVEGYKGQQKFIASQGPTQATLEDFVRMLSEQGVEVVVMLTNLTEDGKIKCERYWPEDGEIQTGDIKVKLTTTQVFADYTIRRLQLLQEGEPSQTVTQFHFTSWPDKDVPTTAWSLVDFEQRVASVSTDKPIVVHCSAGVGRTGTFIALHNVLREGTDTGHMDFFTTVQKLRQDRAFMVQTLDQYIFLHRAAQIAVVCMETTVSASNITERIKSLEKTSKLGQSNLKLEFKAICSLCDDRVPDKDETNMDQISSTYENSQTLSNKLKNRFQNILAKDDYRVFLTGDSDEGSGDYINAVFLPRFSRKNQQILTQLPLPATVTDFWQMVTQYKVTLLVAFQMDLMHNDSSIGNYFPLNENEELSVSHFTIKSLRTSSGVLLNKQKLVITKDTCMAATMPVSNIPEEGYCLTHVICKGSLTDQKPADWFTLIKELRSCRPVGDGRTVYMCRNGAEYSGLVCVLSLLLDRLDNDHRLTVPLVVGAIKAIRPQVIPTVHQYKLLYQVLKLYNDSNNVYSNFGE